MPSILSSPVHLLRIPHPRRSMALCRIFSDPGMGRCSCVFEVRGSYFSAIPPRDQTFRYHLEYHTAPQIVWGFGIGAIFGFALFLITELIPRRRPRSLLGRLRVTLLSNPIFIWIRIRDGWAVWADGGREDEWLRWRAEWTKLVVKEKSN